MGPPQGAPPQAVAGGVRTSRAWAFALMAVVVILTVGFLTWYIAAGWFTTMKKVPDQIREFAANVARPKVVINEVVMSSVEDVRRQNKLVVLKVTVTADVTRQEGSSSWGMYWGTNTARVVARDARAQYYIDLAGIGTSDFVYDEKAKTVTVTVPRPQLDTQMGSIDPSKIQTLDLSGGWMRWNKRETWERAVAELVPKVITEASRPIWRKQAEDAGKEAMMGLLRPMSDTVGKDGVVVEVRYRD